MQKGAHYVALHTSTHQEITRFTGQGLRWCQLHFRDLYPVSVYACMIFFLLWICVHACVRSRRSTKGWYDLKRRLLDAGHTDYRAYAQVRYRVQFEIPKINFTFWKFGEHAIILKLFAFKCDSTEVIRNFLTHYRAVFSLCICLSLPPFSLCLHFLKADRSDHASCGWRDAVILLRRPHVAPYRKT